MLNMSTCTHHTPTLCTDCDKSDCIYAGKKSADCPKFNCDNIIPHDCDNCSFIADYIRIMRNELRKNA